MKKYGVMHRRISQIGRDNFYEDVVSRNYDPDTYGWEFKG